MIQEMKIIISNKLKTIVKRLIHTIRNYLFILIIVNFLEPDFGFFMIEGVFFTRADNNNK